MELKHFRSQILHLDYDSNLISLSSKTLLQGPHFVFSGRWCMGDQLGLWFACIIYSGCYLATAGTCGTDWPCRWIGLCIWRLSGTTGSFNRWTGLCSSRVRSSASRYWCLCCGSRRRRSRRRYLADARGSLRCRCFCWLGSWGTWFSFVLSTATFF